MKRTQVEQEIGGVDVRRLWYVPNRRLTTKSAATKACQLVDWIETGEGLESEPTEERLFIALHVCAYRASRQPRNTTVTDAERAKWVRRWTIIRDHIVENNLGLAYSMIGRLNIRHLDEDGMLSEALLGLIRATDRFNPWKGYRFSTYACNVIARALMRRGKREGDYRKVFPVQFETAYETPPPGTDAGKDLFVERLTRVLDQNACQLSELETQILGQRSPEERQDRLTFQQIGKVVGLSKERVRQIQNGALSKLREALATDPVLQ